MLLSYSGLMIKQFLPLHMQIMGATLQKILPALMDWIAVASFGFIGLYFFEFDEESVMTVDAERYKVIFGDFLTNELHYVTCPYGFKQLKPMPTLHGQACEFCAL